MANERDSLQSPAVWMPTTIEKAVALKKQYGTDATYSAGATLYNSNGKTTDQSPTT